MGGDSFRFKRFTVRHDRCAMKVTTEGCLFGAWLASHLSEPRRMLDIGAGTGLLMLMAAQAFDCPIEGIEIDPEAATQAQENLYASPWADRLTLHTGDVRDFRPGSRCDLLVSNPPFHKGSLKSGDPRVDMARHDDTLSLRELLESADRLMTDDGSLAVWLPCDRALELEGMAGGHGLHTSQRLQVSRMIHENPFRCLVLLGRQPCSATTDSLHIRDKDGNYGERFSEMLKPYYLDAAFQRPA